MRKGNCSSRCVLIKGLLYIILVVSTIYAGDKDIYLLIPSLNSALGSEIPLASVGYTIDTYCSHLPFVFGLHFDDAIVRWPEEGKSWSMRLSCGYAWTAKQRIEAGGGALAMNFPKIFPNAKEREEIIRSIGPTIYLAEIDNENIIGIGLSHIWFGKYEGSDIGIVYAPNFNSLYIDANLHVTTRFRGATALEFGAGSSLGLQPFSFGFRLYLGLCFRYPGDYYNRPASEEKVKS